MNFNFIKLEHVGTVLENLCKEIREKGVPDEVEELRLKVQERLNEIEEI